VAAQFLTTVAVVVQATALGVLVYDLTGRELDLGLLGLAEFLPTALLAPIAGPLADRVDRRRVVAAALAVEAICAVALAAYVAQGPTSVGPVFAVVVVFGLARGFAVPAMRALPADLAARSGALPRLVAFSSATWQLAIIVGPVTGGLLYAGRPFWPFALAAIGMLAGAAIVSTVPRQPVRRNDLEQSHPLREALDGLRFVRRNRIVLGAVSLDLMAVLFGGAVALLPALAQDRLGVGPVGLGWLRAAIGIGAGATTLALAARPVGRHVGVVLFGAVAAFGVFTVVLGVTTNYVVAFVALALLSAADSVSVFIRATIVPLATPEEMRGRVLAVENVFIGASNELGAFESGVAAQALGLMAAVVTGGAATLVVVVVWALWFPELRRADRFADVLAAPVKRSPPG
jgi:MFS family permease